MGTSRRLAGAAASLAAALTASAALAACGGGSGKSPAAFLGLHPGPPPPGWPVTRIAIGARLPYPPGWRRVHSDPGTVTAATFGDHGQFLGYLNLTPRQGAETLGNWTRFRVEHNSEEGDRDLTVLGTAPRLRLGGGEGSCVKDAYTTFTGARYVEIACLVAGRRSAVVVVGASPPQTWNRISALLERAISGVIA